MASKVVKATDDNLQVVTDFIHEQLPSSCSDAVLGQLDLAIEEIYVNIAHYAYTSEVGNAEITCTVSEDQSEIVIVFADSGVPFDPLAKKDPDITLSADERDIGGLGIFLTKKFMNSVEYAFKDGKNILTIKKTLCNG